jgi:predicted DNA-binding transcriptional regulator AlpA
MIAGVIPSFKLGRAVRFRASEVLAALERHRAS